MATSALPLNGIRILDLSRVLAGPWCTQLLGDLGADVLKIESPDGDVTKTWGPPFEGSTASYYFCTNRNKKIHVIDFSKAKDLQNLFDMIKTADVIVENFKPGSLEKFGLDSASILKKYPKVIYCSIRGFGSESSRAQEAGYDVLIQGLAGLMSITGPKGEPHKVGVAVSDLLTGLYASSAILAAYIEKQKSGLGQAIEVPLFETQVACLANVVQGYLSTKQVPESLGNDHPQIFPYGSFETKDGYIILGVGTDLHFVQLCKKLSVNWDKDARFLQNNSRVIHREELRLLMDPVLKTKTTAEWCQHIKGVSFPFGPIQTVGEVLESADGKKLIASSTDGHMQFIKNPIRFSRTPLWKYNRPE